MYDLLLTPGFEARMIEHSFADVNFFRNEVHNVAKLGLYKAACNETKMERQ